jgi:3-hydroxybutyryl-CoA dehydrogenase
MIATGFCDDESLTAAFGRIRTTTDPTEAARGADLVSESVIERLDVKRAVHARFDELCPPHTILTTNTSSLVVSEIEDAVERGGRFAALHSHLGSPLYDIVGGPRTTPETIDVLGRYVLSLGGVPLVLTKENPGYIVNALLGPLLATAAQLVVSGRFDVETVDRAWMAHRDAPIGPFGLIDLFGLDLVLHSWENQSADDAPFRIERRERAMALLRPLVEQGHHGMKTGRGFYEYPEPAYQRAGFLDDPDPDAYAPLVAAITLRAVLLADDGVAEPHVVDLAWTVATSQGIGPFGLIDEMGPERFEMLRRGQLAAGLIAEEEAEQIARFLRSPDTP